LATAAFFLLSMVASANAADMAVKVPPPPPMPTPYNWEGLYVGANFGGAWTQGHLNVPGDNFYAGLTEFIAGVQAGYNVQLNHLLFGIEGTFDGATFAHPTLPTPTLGSVSQHWLATVAGRAGASLRIVGLSTASWAAAGWRAAPCSMLRGSPGPEQAQRTAGSPAPASNTASNHIGPCDWNTTTSD
jgi:opacity protein-like surface antigen